MSETMRRCETCGGTLVRIGTSNFWRCEYCRNEYEYSQEKGQALIFALNRASEHRLRSDFDGAIVEYSTILKEYPKDEEANWGMFIARCGIEYVKDDRTGEFIPTCHRTLKEDVLSDGYYQAAIKNATSKQAEKYAEQAKVISRLQKRILRQMEDEEEYEVFISFKAKDEEGYPTKDSVIARNIHDKLQAAGIKTFFSEVTLKNRIGDEYEPIIYKALHSCKQFILVTTSEAHTNAVWVKNEWSRFRDRMLEENRNKCAFAVFEGKDSVPTFLRGMQGYDLSKYPNGGYEIAIADYLSLALGKVQKTDENAELKKRLEEQQRQMEEMRQMMSQMSQIQNATPAQQPASLTEIQYNELDFYIQRKELIKYRDRGQATNVVIPKGVEKIRSGAFSDCKNVKSIIIPSSLTYITNNAFSNCPNLTNVTIPNSITSIGDSAFV